MKITCYWVACIIKKPGVVGLTRQNLIGVLRLMISSSTLDNVASSVLCNSVRLQRRVPSSFLSASAARFSFDYLAPKLKSTSAYDLATTSHRAKVSKFGSSTRNSTDSLSKLDLSMADEVHCSDSNYAEIIVVRHGETEWNSHGRIQGHLDVELNEAGRQQANAVADRLSKEPKISVIYSSDLKRAYETAQTIANYCGGLEVIKDPELRERHLGDLQGLVLREAAELNPQAYKSFLSHGTDQEIPGGGESLDQLFERCTSALERIGGKHKGERVVVVTHGGVIRTLYNRACPHRRFGKVLNTSVNIFNLYDGQKWILKSWGDISHLNQTGVLQSGFGGDRTSG